jgi:hypothetical protein
MDRRITGALILLLGLALAGGIIYVLFFYNFNAQPAVKPPVQPAVTDNKSAGQPPTPKTTGEKKIIDAGTPVAPKAVGEEDLKQMAGLFAERFGSYSNQSNYRNLRDLEIFMTVKFAAWAEDFIKKQIESKEDTSIYYGISSKSISMTVNEFKAEEGVARIMVSTQRRESLATGANAAGFRQNIEIVFLKQGGVWKVDEANWQTK